MTSSFFGRATDLWAPLVFLPEQYGDNRRTNEFLVAAGRLKPGVTVEQAKRDVAAFADGLRRDYPDAYSRQWTIIATSMNELATRRIRTALLVLAGAVGFVLLIACANIANLLLARAASRTREVAVRAAVGATRADLIRQFMVTSTPPNKPAIAKLVLHYADSDVGPGGPGELQVRYYRGSLGTWLSLPATVDPATHTVTVRALFVSVIEQPIRVALLAPQ